MPATTIPSPVALFPTVDAWLADMNERFAANRYGQIDDADFRAVFTGMAQVFADWRHLSVKRVKGATYPVPYTDNLGLVAPAYRILGMQAVALNGTDSATGAAGALALPVYYTLLRLSTGDVDALLDGEADTTLTVKAQWVRTSGTNEEKMASYKVLPLQGGSLYAGEVYQYTFSALVPAVTRLLEIRQDITSANHPVPTGLDSDPNYKPFAPLTVATGYDDTAVRAELAVHETRIGTLEIEVSSTETRVTATELVANAQKQRLDTLVANAPQAFDTLKEISDQLANDETGAAAMLATQQQQTVRLGQLASTDGLSEGGTNKYFTAGRAVGAALTGYARAGYARMLAASDSVLIALGILEKKSDDNAAAITANTNAIGPLYNLTTTNKTSLVQALNEVKSSNQTFGTGTFGFSSLLRLNNDNAATAYQSSVLAGESSTASGQYSTVISGYINRALGHWAVILGGDHNTYGPANTQSLGAIVGSRLCTVNARLCLVSNSENCTIASGCDNTTLIGCTGLNITTGTNQTYLNNVLVGSSGGPDRRDLFTIQGYRTNELVLEGSKQLTNPKAGPNVQTIQGQVVRTNTGTLAAYSAPRTGTVAEVFAAVTADLTAINAPVTELVYVYFIAGPVAASAPTHLLFTISA